MLLKESKPNKIRDETVLVFERAYNFIACLRDLRLNALFPAPSDKVESVRVGKWLFCDIIIHRHQFKLMKSNLKMTP